MPSIWPPGFVRWGQVGPHMIVIYIWVSVREENSRDFYTEGNKSYAIVQQFVRNVKIGPFVGQVIQC